ncbi:MAG: DUF3024 domain-containing protein [Spirochaetaceae bacterium]|nr:DUF3024 domain-containing protein [Spirochaetaceae bacterium]
MALTEWQLAEIKVAADKYLGKRNAMISEWSDQEKCEYRIEGLSVIIFERRKSYMGTGYENFDVAKATYRKTSNDWKLFCMRQDLKWHGYELDIIHDNIESVFRCVDKDECCAFWG